MLLKKSPILKKKIPTIKDAHAKKEQKKDHTELDEDELDERKLDVIKDKQLYFLFPALKSFSLSPFLFSISDHLNISY